MNHIEAQYNLTASQLYLQKLNIITIPVIITAEQWKIYL